VRLLVIAYHYPPDPSVGAHRWVAMARYLRELGHEVTVLTTRVFGTLPDDDRWVVRGDDLAANERLRRVLRRPSLQHQAAPAPPAELVSSALFTRVVVPDTYALTWVPFAQRLARSLVCDRAIDCVITSGPPHSLHLCGQWLSRGSTGPAWLADYRDGWRFEPLLGAWPTPPQEWLDAWLERRAARSAGAIAAATLPIAEDFQTRLGIPATHVPNAWDPADDVRVGELGVPAGMLDPATLNVVHAGKLSGPRGRDPRPLFEALARLAARRPQARERLRLVLAGRLDAHDERLLADQPAGEMVRHVGHLSRMQAAALQRGADALLLLTSVGHASQATGKLFEYLAAERPILALASDNEAARIVAETGTGVCVPPEDVEAIERALEEVLDGVLGERYAPHDLERYRYPAPALQVAALLDAAVAARRGGRS
jgi:glycosyltransferase involved in cell wall biosynthesis